jgi:biopolymer transport protein ExbB/TolQ
MIKNFYSLDEEKYLVMSGKARVKPTKEASLLGLIVSFFFLIIGFAIIPIFGPFGVIWLIFVILILVYYALNAFSEEGLALEEIQFEQTGKRDEIDDLEEKLRKLARLREEGLLTEEEYQRKREEVIRGSSSQH